MKICDASLLRRKPLEDDAEALASVAQVLADVRARGDDALRDYTERFDIV